MRKFSLVVPIFNEEEALPFTGERLRSVIPALREANCAEIEFIFVNDGSADQTARVLKAECEKFMAAGAAALVIEFSRNFGHSAAVFAGLAHASGDLIGIIDADLQDPPELLARMVRELDSKNADVVYGKRVARAGEGAFKRFTAWGFYRVLNALSGVDIPRDTGDFRVMTREVADAVSSLTETEPFLRGLVAWVGFRQVEFPYERHSREHGTTKYPFRKMMRFAMLAILSFSQLPLRLAIYLGLLGVVASVSLAALALSVFFNGKAIPGWASTIIGFTFGQSTTLVVVGIIGIYLGRVHQAMQNRPRYIIRRGQNK